jgi:hypothetical protein
MVGWLDRRQDNFRMRYSDPRASVISKFESSLVNLTGKHFHLKNCTFKFDDLHSLFPPNSRTLGYVAVE